MANHFNSISSNSETVLMGQGNEGGNFGRKTWEGWRRFRQRERTPHWGTLVSWTFHNELLQTWWIITTEICPLMTLEGRSLKSRRQQGWFHLEALRKNPLHASLLASGDCWKSLVFLSLELHHSNLCFCLHITSCCLLLFLYEHLLLDSEPSQVIQGDLISRFLT